jgi:hypothetical protein
LPEVVPHVQSHVAVDATTLKKHADALWKLPPDLRRKLLRSMERFVLSQCRPQTGDRALDSVIAFETAVSGGKGDNAPVNWKIGVKAAQLIGGTLQQGPDPTVVSPGAIWASVHYRDTDPGLLAYRPKGNCRT